MASPSRQQDPNIVRDRTQIISGRVVNVNLTLEEQETAITMSADDRGIWQVFSDDPVMQRRFENIGATLVKVSADGVSKWYTLPAKQISLRQPKKPMSNERRAQLAKQLREQRIAS